jgi:hypothetical protein
MIEMRREEGYEIRNKDSRGAEERNKHAWRD